MTILLAFLSSDKSFLLIFLISELKSDLSNIWERHRLCLGIPGKEETKKKGRGESDQDEDAAEGAWTISSRGRMWMRMDEKDLSLFYFISRLNIE